MKKLKKSNLPKAATVVRGGTGSLPPVAFPWSEHEGRVHAQLYIGVVWGGLEHTRCPDTTQNNETITSTWAIISTFESSLNYSNVQPGLNPVG